MLNGGAGEVRSRAKEPRESGLNSPVYKLPRTPSTLEKERVVGKDWKKLIAYATTFCSMFAVSQAAPFFPTYAHERFKASESFVGLTFACNPIAQVSSAALWTALVARIGRTDGLIVGLAFIAVGSLVFSQGDSMYVFMLGRFLQGVGTQGTNSAGVAMILEASSDFQRDMGLQELIVGVAYMTGPALGGLLYEHAGFRYSVLPSFFFSTVLAIVAFCTIRGGERGMGYDMVSMSAGAQEEGRGHRAEAAGGGGDSAQRIVLKNRTAMCVCAAVLAHAAAQGFCDSTLGKHIQLSKGSDASVAGIVFSISPAVYCVACWWVGTLTWLPNDTQIFVGLLLYSAGFFFLAPPPGTNISQTADWFLDAFALALTGVGSALILVPSVPLMLGAMSQSTSHDLTDAVASVYSGSWSMGELMGPPLGGLMLEQLPRTRELNCTEEGDGCSWAFQNTMLFFAMVLFATSVLHMPLIQVGTFRRGKEAGKSVAWGAGWGPLSMSQFSRSSSTLKTMMMESAGGDEMDRRIHLSAKSTSYSINSTL